MRGRTTTPLAVTAFGALVALALTAPPPAAGQTLVGVVYDSTRAAPLAEAEVHLSGTDAYAVTDEDGLFQLEDVPPGHNTVTLAHPRLEVMGVELSVEVVLREGEASWAEIPVPGRASLAPHLCPTPGSAVRDDRGLFVGRVVEDETGGPVPEATVAVMWRSEDMDAGVEPAGALEREGWRQARIPVDEEGRFVFCSAPPEGEIRVQVARGEGLGDPVVMTVPGTGVAVREFRLAGVLDEADLQDMVARLMEGRLPEAPAEPGADEEAEEVEGFAMVTGRVVAADTGEPVSAARVTVGGDEEFSGVTDGEGRFRIPDVPAGLRTVEVEYLGFSSRPTRLLLEDDATLETELSVVTDPVPLPDIEVVVERTRRPGLLAGFEERREQGVGQHFIREDVEQRSGGRLHHFFRTVRGMRAVRCGSGETTPPDCYLPVVTRGVRQCVPSVYLDGVRWPLSPSAGINQIWPDELEAVEVYAGPAGVPPRFLDQQASRCGVVVLWTRRGR